MKVIINGIGIAGPTLAWWLSRSGHDVLLVEKSREFRRGGYAIDFWGIGYDIAEKMGLLPRILEHGHEIEEMRYVDRLGRRSGGFPVGIFDRMTHGRYIQLRRSDLSATIYDALEGKVETIVGDSVAELDDDSQCVQVGFDHAASRRADLVIGGDGLHSRVRELAFGPEAEFEVSLGYRVAAFEIDGYRPRDERVAVTYSVPGRQITRLSMRDNKTLFLLVFRDEYLPAATVGDGRGQKDAVKNAFAGIGWEAPGILAAMDGADDVYFDRVSQIRMDRWTRGRVALVGDAAACVPLLAGEGTGLAMAEAYALAGELHACAGDHVTAFAHYEQRMMPFLRRKQESAVKFASSFAPKSAIGITFRNQVTRLLRIPWVAEFVIGRSLHDDVALPEYGLQDAISPATTIASSG